ncbi:energy transducer TonB [Terriglobus sp. RCC_193]|uniref:energy transducer TonB n=1 Tax=Terriglobus sp. RCC_193 TaxID=3239218 RepID=UPI00352462C2
MPPYQTPSDEPTQETPQPEESPRHGNRGGMGRYADLEQHELIMLLDEVDDERTRARFREAVYISVIVWLILGWVLVYGPRYLWHAPVIVMAPDNEKRSTMTYLDTPPDLKDQLKRTKPAPNISAHTAESQSSKPNPQVQPTPRAGTPAPPAPKQAPQQQQAAPAPQQQQAPPQQQVAKNAPPTPTPPVPHPQPMVDSPAPNASANNRPNFGQGSQSAASQIAQAARGSRNAGDSGDYGSVGRGQPGGAKQGLQILSDTQGVDFGKYIQRLLSDVRRNWLPLIPEECRPPLNKQGITGVRFTILPDGKISAMHLDYSTHDVAIDRAAWGSITALGAAQPLPKEFHGPNLELRIEFRINKDSPEAQ